MFYELLVGIITLCIGAGGRILWEKISKQRKLKGQSALLSGMKEPVKFIFPPREELETSFLPRISTEDFMAINNLISAFILSGRVPPPSKVADSKNIALGVKRNNNLILICSSKTNAATKDAIQLIKEANPKKSDLIPEFIIDDKSNSVQIYWRRGYYPSDSYKQEGPEYNDVAMIIKAQNPWAAQYKLLIIAGIRGIGTWGAAEFLKKWWKPLYERKGYDKSNKIYKTGNFAALVHVTYKEYDISNVELIDVVDLDNYYIDSN